MKNSSWTGRAPRNMQTAFGPYTDPHIYDTTPTPAWHGWAYVVVCLTAVAGIAVMLFTEV